MDWFRVFMLTVCFVHSDGHKHHYKQLQNEIEKQREEMLDDSESVRKELLLEMNTIFNGSGDQSVFITKIIVETVKKEVRRTVSEMAMTECQKSQKDLQRLSAFADDAEKKITSYKETMQETYEDMLQLWYDCREKERDIERLMTQVKDCKCPETPTEIDQVTKISTSASRGNRSRDAFGLVIADDNSDKFKLMYLNSKRVRTLNSGRRNVTDIVYNHLDGRLYYSLPDSVWSSYLNGGDEILLRNCTTFCMKVSFDATLALLQYVEYNSSSREYIVCEISLYDDNGDTSCEEIPYIPLKIIRLGTFAINMNDRKVVSVVYDGGKVHSVQGYFNISELGLNETDDSLPRSGEFYEISYFTLRSLSALHTSPDASEKSREIITRVPAVPTSLTIDGVGKRVFIVYDHRDVIDVFDLDTETISIFTKMKKPWGAARQMCLIN